MPQDGAPSSIDVLAAQVREPIRRYLRLAGDVNPRRVQSWIDALAALDALVARAKEAEERAEAHLMLRKEAASWAEEVELERDALVARVTEAERDLATANEIVAEVYERPAALWAMGLDWMARAGAVLAESRRCACPAGSYDYPNAVHEPYCPAARLDGNEP